MGEQSGADLMVATGTIISASVADQTMPSSKYPAIVLVVRIDEPAVGAIQYTFSSAALVQVLSIWNSAGIVNPGACGMQLVDLVGRTVYVRLRRCDRGEGASATHEIVQFLPQSSMT